MDKKERIERFEHLRLGLFMHFGLYSAAGEGEWAWHNLPGVRKIYGSLKEHFDPEKLDFTDILSKARDAGMRYAVLTARHHDGFAMWPSDAGTLSTKNHLGGRDIVGEYVDACRKVGLKVGLYYSPPDWYFNQKYMSFMIGSRSEKYPDRPNKDIDHKPTGDLPPMPEEHYLAYCGYLNEQIKELMTRYGKIDVLWFDGSVKDTSHVMSADDIRTLQPGIVINDRLWGIGDYCTKYECRMPTERPKEKYWEACVIWHVGGGWSYVKNADKYRRLEVSMEQYDTVKRFGGNFMLNIAPDRDGVVPAAYYAAAKELSGAIGEKYGAV